IYRYIYPKKKINLFILLLIISILPVISLLRAGDYESGDFNIHIYRIIAFFNVLKEGILMPSWAADLNSSYGNPLFIFNYSFPYYLISLFHFLGIDFINGAKLYLGLVFYLSGIAMYFATKEITGNKLASFTSSVFYMFNPYHLIDVHFRATLGESTIFLIVPLLFFLITKYFKENNYLYLILNSLLTVTMVMAHPLLAVSFSILITLYILFIGIIKRKIKFIFLSISSLALGGIAASYAWVSFIIYKPYMFNFPSDTPIFYAFDYFFYSPWRYGFLFQGPKGELAEIVGYTQFLVLIILAILYLKNKIKSSLKHYILFWITMFLLLLFLMHPFSIFFWKKLPFFWMLLPYGRLSLIVTFCTSILAGYLAFIYSNKKQSRTMVYILIIITIGYTILNWGHRRVIPEITE
ncbi:MAG: 6-pyruvoyl-tetrahydropterin synthase-related protein, partial [Nanoarchaeota archaeon]